MIRFYRLFVLNEGVVRVQQSLHDNFNFFAVIRFVSIRDVDKSSFGQNEIFLEGFCSSSHCVVCHY